MHAYYVPTHDDVHISLLSIYTVIYIVTVVPHSLVHACACSIMTQGLGTRLGTSCDSPSIQGTWGCTLVPAWHSITKFYNIIMSCDECSIT